MALGPQLDLRQSQSLVMTPQLQQAIKLLALSNLEIEGFIGEALEANPLLEAGEVRRDKQEGDGETASKEDAGSDQLMAKGAGEADAPLDIKSLLYVPAKNMETLGLARSESEVHLYCRKVLIQSKAEQLPQSPKQP